MRSEPGNQRPRNLRRSRYTNSRLTNRAGAGTGERRHAPDRVRVHTLVDERVDSFKEFAHKAADKLKSLITGDTIQIERKFGSCRQVPNRLKTIATTNHDHQLIGSQRGRAR